MTELVDWGVFEKLRGLVKGTQLLNHSSASRDSGGTYSLVLGDKAGVISRRLWSASIWLAALLGRLEIISVKILALVGA